MRKEVVMSTIMVLLFCVSVLFGCVSEEVKATIKGYEVTDFDGRPAIKVNVETNEYPITIYLLGPDRRTIDMKVIESEKDIPAILYLGISGINVKPGTYYLKLEYGTKTLEEKSITIQGPKIQFINAKFDFEKTFMGYELKKIEMSLKNTGDCPAYLYWVKVKIGDKDSTDVIEEYKVPLKPGETKVYTAKDLVLYIEKPGTYTATIEISGFGGTVLGKFTKTVEVR